MSGTQLPAEVVDFLLVGRIVERGSQEDKEVGVVKYVTTKFGQGKHHDGLPFVYPPGPWNDPNASPKTMKTDFEFAVFWEGREQPEMMSLDEVHEIVTERFTNAEWLPASIRELIADGWDGKWKSLQPNTVHRFMKATQRKEEAQIKKDAAAARRRQSAAAKQQQSTKGKAAARANGESSGAPKRKPSKKEDAPLQAATGLGAALQAKKEARKRKIAEEAAAGAVSPPPKRSVLVGNLAPVSRAAAAAAAARAAATAHSAAAAAAAAHVEPSPQGSPGGCAQSNQPMAAGHKRKQVQQRQREQGTSSCSLVPASTKGQQQQQPGGSAQAKGKAASGGAGAAKAPSSSKGKQQLLSAGKQGASGGGSGTSKGKQQLLSAGKQGASGGGAGTSKGKQQKTPVPGKSRCSTGGGQDLPDVLMQADKKIMDPVDSGFLMEDEGRSQEVECEGGGRTDVYWYDRVRGSDDVVYRVYSQRLVVPEAQCYRPKADKPLKIWKIKPQKSAEYAVEGVLAEEEDIDGGKRYLVKWQGYEADPGEGGWLQENEMGDCQELLEEWQKTGQEAWMAACRMLLTDAGLEQSQ